MSEGKKENLICIALAIAAFVMAYLVGVFVAADFDIRHWPFEGRVIVAFMGLWAADTADARKSCLKVISKDAGKTYRRDNQGRWVTV